MRSSLRWMILACCTPLLEPALLAQGVDVSAKIVMHSDKRPSNASHKDSNASNVVVWLSPQQPVDPKPVPSPHSPYRLLQKDKQFQPHLLVVPTGTSVEFPNADPFFHNVFSLFNGKRFDLGLYESGTTRSVKFDREGVSYIFCNIHPEMSAVIVALQTPYFAQTDAEGKFEMANIPAGRYKIRVWHELASASELEGLAHDVQINPGENLLPALVLHVSDTTPAHTNKYGEAYSRDRNPY